MSRKKRSAMFSQESDVGVKRALNRECLGSQSCTTGCLKVACCRRSDATSDPWESHTIVFAQELQPFGVGMSLQALVDRAPAQHVDLGKQRGRRVAVVVAVTVWARPFVSGSPGCARSSACTWLFASHHSTSACLGRNT